LNDGFVADCDIPVPVSYGARGGRMEALRRLKVGESVFFEGAAQNIISGSARTISQREADKASWKWIARTVEGGVRVWRIA
jgi:hypothetical protein